MLWIAFAAAEARDVTSYRGIAGPVNDLAHLSHQQCLCIELPCERFQEILRIDTLCNRSHDEENGLRHLPWRVPSFNVEYN
ncbi:hypothetical protein INR49_022775 [Caranx melampygus]|nr:hypothetical protein INR49_022775 [Caranx melampygus]